MKKQLLSALVLSSLLLTTPVFAADDDLSTANSIMATQSKQVKEDAKKTTEEGSTPIQSTDLKNGALTVMNGAIENQIKKSKQDPNAPAWLKNGDISFRLETNLKPQYSFETIVPTHQDKLNTDFVQFRLGNDLEAGTVANIGIGHRKLSEDKTTMYGVNAFFDHGFKYGHERVSLGGEYFFGNNEFRVNAYHGISGAKEVDSTSHIFERVLDGYDYELGTSIPKAPWMRLYAQGFSWDYKYSDDAVGYKVRTVIQVTPRFNLEYGYWDDNKGPGHQYAKFMYNLSETHPAMFEDNKNVFRNGDKVSVEDKRLQKVNRDNNIEVERYIPYSPNPSGKLLTVSMERQ
jgi:hypothetical protein